MKYLLLFLLPISSFGASIGSITLMGVVPAIVSISVATVAGFDNLDFSTTQTAKVVSSVTETSNTATGYKVTVSSLNAGKFKNGANLITYTAKYNGTAFALALAPVTITNTVTSAVVNVTKNISIAYTGVPLSSLAAGSYTDTLTFTITSN